MILIFYDYLANLLVGIACFLLCCAPPLFLENWCSSNCVTNWLCAQLPNCSPIYTVAPFCWQLFWCLGVVQLGNGGNKQCGLSERVISLCLLKRFHSLARMVFSKVVHLELMHLKLQGAYLELLAQVGRLSSFLIGRRFCCRRAVSAAFHKSRFLFLTFVSLQSTLNFVFISRSLLAVCFSLGPVTIAID